MRVVIVVADGKIASCAVVVGDGAVEAGGGVLDAAGQWERREARKEDEEDDKGREANQARE